MADDTLLTLTADIVSAHVSNNSVSNNDLPILVQNVYGALSGLGEQQQEAASPAKRAPIVSPRVAIKPDAITCLVCGARQKMLKRHISTAHQMTPADYRAEFSLKSDYPMVAPDYAKQRRSLALSIGLGQKRAKPATPAKRGRKPKAAATEG
jgi:predicted transcriptional regulator